VVLGPDRGRSVTAAIGEFLGGYLPSSFELPDLLRWGQPNEIAVRVDSTERADIPPFGGRIDYLTFGESPTPKATAGHSRPARSACSCQGRAS